MSRTVTTTQTIANRLGISERQLIVDTLHACHWNAYEAAERVHVTFNTFYARMRAHDIPTVVELTSFWYGGHFDTICGHAARLGLPKARTHQRYRRGLALELVFAPEKLGEISGRNSVVRAGRPPGSRNLGRRDVPAAGVGQ